MLLKDRIEQKLKLQFAPKRVEVLDESHLHAGHAGSRPGGETHFRVHIVAACFQGKSRVERHRLVNAALADELAGQIHALALRADAPGETDRG